MSSFNFIGGEKGGVGKSVVARLLAQYFIDRNHPFTGYDTDRSHTSFARFYADYASPVVVDSYEGLDSIVHHLDAGIEGAETQRVIIDLAAQTAAPLRHWIQDSDLLAVLSERKVQVNFWHVADAGQDSIELLGRLVESYGWGPNYVVVRNQGRGQDFGPLDGSPALAKALYLGARLITLPALHEGSMNKIDRHNVSFWSAAQQTDGPAGLGLLERQRVKTWLKRAYEEFDTLPL